MLYVGFCRVCGTGPLGLRTCGQCGQVVILCDECDAAWTSADLQATPTFTNDPQMPCPACESSLFHPPSHWTTNEEALAVDWLHDAVREGALAIEKGKPFVADGEEEDA